MRILSILLVCLVLAGGQTFAQKKKKDSGKSSPPASQNNGKSDDKKKEGPQPYKQVVTKSTKTQKGLFTVHKNGDDYLFEIPDSIFNREFIAITRLAKTPAGAGYGGEEENRQVMRWEKGPGNKVFLRAVLYINTSGDTLKPIQLAVKNSNLDPIAAAFDVKSIRKDTSVVINVTDFFKGDNQVVSLDPSKKKRFSLGNIQSDRSYIQSIKSFPINTEVRTVKTFSSNTPQPGNSRVTELPAGASSGAVTLEVNTSMILLPAKPARKRYFDNRVGFFATGYTTYGEESQRAESDVFIVHWRLEPRPQDIEKMKRGELVEPIKPIVYYIDPATPKVWRPYIKKGIEDWQKAFEQAGFKNAILAKEVPEGDTTISPEDARYSFVRYFASDVQNAYGPNVNDPRTGEILESHIGWYHNVMKLLHSWYTIQTAAVDPKARTKEFDDELMGQLIRFVASHEVGHTLGLRHNFGSSSGTPVEKLRDKAYLEKYGHTASIMDYARFNYVAQPEDNIPSANLMPGIGTYDRWAIEWGYKPIFDTKDAEADKKILNKWILSHAGDPMYWFGSEINPYDPRCQSEDLGNNAMIASGYGIKNLKRIVPMLHDWYKEEGEKYTELDEMYNQVVSQFRRYMGHVTKYVGGVYETPKSYDQEGAVYVATPANLQRDAVSFLNEQLFQTPTWLLDQSIFKYTKPGTGVDQLVSMQESTLNGLFNYDRMARLIETSTADPKAYSLDNLFTDVRTGIWSELKSRKAIDTYRRNLQKAHVEKLIALLDPKEDDNSGGFFRGSPFFPSSAPSPSADPRVSDVMSLARGHLEALRSDIRSSLAGYSDKMSRYHLQDVLARINDALEGKK